MGDAGHSLKTWTAEVHQPCFLLVIDLEVDTGKVSVNLLSRTV